MGRGRDQRDSLKERELERKRDDSVLDVYESMGRDDHLRERKR